MWLFLALIILWLPPPRFKRWTFVVTVQDDTATDDYAHTTHRRIKGSVWSRCNV